MNAAVQDGAEGMSSLQSLGFSLNTLYLSSAKDWVIEQTRERARRELEADEREYEDRLAEARKREILMKKMAKARVIKKTVGQLLSLTAAKLNRL